MDVESLGYRTDLALLRLGGSTIEDRGDHLVVRSPYNPTFYWGNFLLLEHVPAPAWNEDDRVAFSIFIEQRIRPAMVRALANVRTRQEGLLKTSTLAGAFARMWRDGVHPLQDESEGDD